MPELPPLLNKRSLRPFGWNENLIVGILGKPDLVQQHKRGFCHWEEHLYTRERILAGMQDPRFGLHLEAVRARSLAAAQRSEFVTAKYSNWREALPEACAGMFSLNRYAKYHLCSELQKHEIYRLKNELIEALYATGYCTAAWLHNLTLPKQICRECDGDWNCGHCDGSGVYRHERTVQFWCFRFLIAEKPYCWHQPVELVSFSPVASVPPQDWQGLTQTEKPIAIPLRQFASIKRLLRWTLDQAQAEIDQTNGTTATTTNTIKNTPTTASPRLSFAATAIPPSNPAACPASAAPLLPQVQGDLFSPSLL